MFLEAGNTRNTNALGLLRCPDFYEKVTEAILAALVDILFA